MVKYNVVTGFRRGGTSAMMSALRQAGIPIIGFKFSIVLTKQKETDVGTFRALHKVARGNPTGYWEMPSVCLRTGLQEEWSDVGIGGELFKIPFDILAMSNPKMIDTVIVILRNPLCVMKSRIKAPSVEAETKEKMRLSSLSMLYNAILSLRWLKLNKIPYQTIFYEDLLKSPEKELKVICKFLARGNYRWGAKAIQRKLNTSKPVKNDLEEVKMLEEFYNDIRTKSTHKYYDLIELRQRILNLDKKGLVRQLKK